MRGRLIADCRMQNGCYSAFCIFLLTAFAQTAGRSIPIRTAIIAMTTSSSMSVKPEQFFGALFMRGCASTLAFLMNFLCDCCLSRLSDGWHYFSCRFYLSLID